MDWEGVATYVYDETNHMVDGKNELGERSLYTYNGLGIRVGRELIMKDNTHGYTDFHKETPSVDAGIPKAEVSKESYVIDYTSPTFQTLVMGEEGGFEYRWVYGLDKLSVKITSEGTNWWAQNVKQDILKDYLHQDRMGSTTNLTDQFGRVVGRADYNEWGQITYKDALDITSSYRRIYPQLSYTGHDWDDVLGMYYAKARFYDADTKRFVAIDPVKGHVTDPLSLVPYIYCVDNPLRWVDPLGQSYVATYAGEVYPMVEVLGVAGVAGLASAGMAVVAVGVIAVVGIIVISEGIAYYSNSNAWQDRKAEAQRNGVARTSYYNFTKIEQEEQKLLRKTQVTAKQDVTQLAQDEQRLLRQTKTPATAKQDVTQLAQNEQRLLRQAQASATTRQDFTQLAQDEQRLLHKTPTDEKTTPAYVNVPSSHDSVVSGTRTYMAQVECEGQDGKTDEGTDDKSKADPETAPTYEDAKKTGKKAPKHTEVESQHDALPREGEPNSSTDLKKDGKVVERRYYGPDGKADFEIDYTDHGNPGKHKVPHGHDWQWNGNTSSRPECPLPWELP